MILIKKGDQVEIIDAGVMGVRSAVMRLTRRATPLRFTIYPMIHLGEQAFYTEVSRRLREHGLIVAEGIQGADRGSRRLTSVYRLAGGSERLGLVVQPKSMVDVGVPVVWADMTGEDFGKKWREISLAERAIMGGAAPVFGLYMRMFGSREFLARYMPVNNDTAIDNWDPGSGIEKLVSDDREAVLVEALGKIYEERHDEPIDVAIVYGAGHAIPVVAYLMSALGYVVTNAEWLTVFDY
jgi:hypothetical protein